MTGRAIPFVVTAVLGAAMIAGLASAQAPDEPTGTQDEVVDVADNRTVIDPADDADGNESDIDIRSPFDDEFGEQPDPDRQTADDEANATDDEDAPMVTLPLVVVAFAAVLALSRRRR